MELINSYLFGKLEPLQTLIWLNEVFLPKLCQQFNTSDVRRRLGLYAGERIPENERNLTDVRNRVSLIIEYELARVGNDLIVKYGSKDIFFTYVVANRFPDLEIRNNLGKRGLRIEVKCLQSIAEEKSANFDTLKKDINPHTDFLIVFIWDWKSDGKEILWDRSPYLIRAFAFHAASIAELRDYNWLNNPPNTLGDGYQGFDLRFAVNCTNGVYSEEEGNYGKLLRIWPRNTQYEAVNITEILQQTINGYYLFEDMVVCSGIETLSRMYLTLLSKDEVIVTCKINGKVVGYRAGKIGFLSKRNCDKTRLIELLSSCEMTEAYVFTDKYQWKRYSNNDGKLIEIGNGKKPKYILV